MASGRRKPPGSAVGPRGPLHRAFGNGGYPFCIVFGYPDAVFLLQLHHQLRHIQRVGPQVFEKGLLAKHVLFAGAYRSGERTGNPPGQGRDFIRAV
jgi:hypothetical protein